MKDWNWLEIAGGLSLDILFFWAVVQLAGFRFPESLAIAIGLVAVILIGWYAIGDGPDAS